MTHEDRPGCRCGLCGSSSLRVRLKQIRERFKVAHVEGSGAQTFHVHALEDVGALLSLLEDLDAKDYPRRLEQLRCEAGDAENRADNAEQALDRARRDQKAARGKIDEAIAKLREAFP